MTPRRAVVGEFIHLMASMKPAEAIRAATIDAAELLGLKNQIGEIKAGMFADIIAVPGNPLNEISVIEKVAFVMKSGKVIKSNYESNPDNRKE